MTGRYGRPEHEDIVNLIRFEVANCLRRKGFGFRCIVADFLMGECLGTWEGGNRAKQVPDLIFYPRDDRQQAILIEVGEYHPDKWDAQWAVMHVTWASDVYVMNSKKTEFERALTGSIRDVLKGKNSRDTAIIGLLTDCGLRPSELVRLKVDDVIDDEGGLFVGKNDSKEWVKLPPHVWAALTSWKSNRAQIAAPRVPALFINIGKGKPSRNHYGNQISEQSIRSIVRNMGLPIDWPGFTTTVEDAG